MMLAADPVHGTAASFDEERALRKHIGDYALFVGRHVSRGDGFRVAGCAATIPASAS